MPLTPHELNRIREVAAEGRLNTLPTEAPGYETPEGQRFL